MENELIVSATAREATTAAPLFDPVMRQTISSFTAARIDFRNPNFHFPIVAALSAVILFASLHRGDLSGYDDAAYAHEAKTLLQTGDWWTMQLNGKPDFDKPPLFIWFEAMSFWLLGTSDFAAKFPSALLGFATILLTFFLARALVRDRWVPILAMVVLMSTQYFLKTAMHAMTCAPFAFFFTLAIYFYVRGLKRPVFLLWCGVGIGLATLTRSPIGLLLLGIIALHLLLTKQLRLLLSWQAGGGLLLALALPLTWYVKEYLLYGSEFITQHFANIANHAAPLQPKSPLRLAVGYFEYLFLLLKLYWPWLPLLAVGFVAAVRRTLRKRDTTAGLLVIWILCVLIPFSLVDSKVLRYILPAFPAFSILAGCALHSLLAPRRLPVFFKCAYPLLCAVAAAAILFPNYRVRAGDMQLLAPIAKAAIVPGQRVLLYTSGEYKWDYRNQLLWYGERLCTHLTSLEEVNTLLECDSRAVVVLDRAAFKQLADKKTCVIDVLGESENFVCAHSLRPDRLTQALCPRMFTQLEN